MKPALHDPLLFIVVKISLHVRFQVVFGKSHPEAVPDKFANVLDSLGKKPSLITDLKSIVKQEVAIEDRGGIAHPQRFLGKEYRTALYNSTLLIYCISSNQWESRKLAFLTGMGITGFEPEIRKKGKLVDVNVPVPVGEPVKLVTAAQARVWSTPVTVQVSFEETWLRSIIQDEILTSFQLGFTVNGEDLTSC